MPEGLEPTDTFALVWPHLTPEWRAWVWRMLEPAGVYPPPVRPASPARATQAPEQTRRAPSDPARTVAAVLGTVRGLVDAIRPASPLEAMTSAYARTMRAAMGVRQTEPKLRYKHDHRGFNCACWSDPPYKAKGERWRDYRRRKEARNTPTKQIQKGGRGSINIQSGGSISFAYEPYREPAGLPDPTTPELYVQIDDTEYL